MHPSSSSRSLQKSGRAAVAPLARRDAERGSQATEYALLLIVAATVAVLLLNWARGDNGISALLDTLMGEVLGLFGIGG